MSDYAKVSKHAKHDQKSHGRSKSGGMSASDKRREAEMTAEYEQRNSGKNDINNTGGASEGGASYIHSKKKKKRAADGDEYGKPSQSAADGYNNRNEEKARKAGRPEYMKIDRYGMKTKTKVSKRRSDRQKVIKSNPLPAAIMEDLEDTHA